mmetsp:Transcript_10778/g.34191  ORF Transcript_10778/g.34191 Transcript_10778/m.34191 type:complete len:216 (-) Transcript_10778:751-1398(-)
MSKDCLALRQHQLMQHATQQRKEGRVLLVRQPVNQVQNQAKELRTLGCQLFGCIVNGVRNQLDDHVAKGQPVVRWGGSTAGGRCWSRTAADATATDASAVRRLLCGRQRHGEHREQPVTPCRRLSHKPIPVQSSVAVCQSKEHAVEKTLTLRLGHRLGHHLRFGSDKGNDRKVQVTQVCTRSRVGVARIIVVLLHKVTQRKDSLDARRRLRIEGT